MWKKANAGDNGPPLKWAGELYPAKRQFQGIKIGEIGGKLGEIFLISGPVKDGNSGKNLNFY
jgi:hypothetical protein